jgi:hypothetical protein
MHRLSIRPLVATLVMLQYRAMRRDMGFLAVAAVLLIAVLVTLGAIRAALTS